jgi:hypothetical protein
VRLFRDSLRTLQYILEASLYYNPLRIFFLLSALCCGASFIGFAIASATRLTVFYFTGIGLFLTGVLVVCIGFLAALLRQILVTASETPKQQLRYARSTEAIAGAKRNSSAHPSSLAVADSYHGDLMKQTDQEPPQCAE